MSISRLARTRVLESSRHFFNNFSHQNSITSSPILNQLRSISTSSILNQSPFYPSNNYAALLSQSRNFSSGRNFDPYERYMRRTAINWGIRFVPQQEAYVIERFGKFSSVLEAGLHLLIPFVDRIAYIHSLKEQTIEIPEQPAVTTDNVSIRVNGVLFVKVIDAKQASYGNDNVLYAVTQLAQTVMRSAIGKMPLDRTFMERDTINANIVEAINEVASQWGLICRRYEIRDILPPPGIRESMEKQAEAERLKRALIIEAEGKKEAVVLTSDAAKMDQINRATGEAEAIRIVSEALKGNGQAAANLKLARDYVQAYNNMAKESTIMVLPAAMNDVSSTMAMGLSLYQKMFANNKGDTSTFSPFNPTSSATQNESKDDNKATAAENKPVFSLQSPKKPE
ncbi:stomatin-like protein 2, mitochondrial [Chenopodium quinoa]|uniref:stomatin-like protein 2, mitochondrial n=1 Tax=Chenopodium quinoa TaxID=63459 RepID=UPI000B784715|nr:stomatin-like protein 2, mitochondrial [Chenopodium quinoa]